MRPTKRTQVVARSSAIVAAAFLVHSFASAATMYKGSPCNVPQLRESILQQVNQIRARGAYCGSESFKSAGSLAWNDRLVTAAAGHSQDMADNNYFSHTNLRGVKAPARADAAGYKWTGVAENIAAGQFTTNTVMDGWMGSPGHCRNIMNPAYNEIGVACITRQGTVYGDYWTMVLGRR